MHAEVAEFFQSRKRYHKTRTSAAPTTMKQPQWFTGDTRTALTQHHDSLETF